MNFDDYALIEAALLAPQSSALSPSSPVPEPAAGILLLVVGIASASKGLRG
jgi:hypothetical protein